MSEQGASARSSTTTMADQSRPNEGSGAQPLLQHPARWWIGLHLQSHSSGLSSYVRRPRHRCSTSATGLLVRLSARAITRSSQQFRQAETSSTTCRSVRRIPVRISLGSNACQRVLQSASDPVRPGGTNLAGPVESRPTAAAAVASSREPPAALRSGPSSGSRLFAVFVGSAKPI